MFRKSFTEIFNKSMRFFKFLKASQQHVLYKNHHVTPLSNFFRILIMNYQQKALLSLKKNMNSQEIKKASHKKSFSAQLRIAQKIKCLVKQQ